MQQIKDLLKTAMQAQPTPMSPISTARIDWQFETFNDAKLTEMLTQAQRFADEIKSGMPPRWLTFTGVSGIGKTHLAKKLWKWFLNYGCLYTEPTTGARLERSGKRVSWRDAAALIREGDWCYVDDLCERWFVILDDIGAEHKGGTGVVQSTLERILDARIGKWTFITSNLTHKQIATDIDVRVASRLLREGSVVVQCPEVIDFNLRKRQRAA